MGRPCFLQYMCYLYDMKRNFNLILAFAALMVSCNGVIESDNLSAVTTSPSISEETDCIPGVVRIKLRTTPSSADDVKSIMGAAYNVTDVVPVFMDDPRYTQRHHEAGLDRWYDVYFDEELQITKAVSSAKSVPGVEIAEKVRRVKPAAFMNDPYYPVQWHYNNIGDRSKFRAGIDINLEEAWTMQTGSEDVIVAVLDQGVRYTHEDLRDAMWVNEPELNGEIGIDDDGNGYIDDIYGFNFCYNGRTVIGEIEPMDHGTHVAGTIAAVNNNGIGVCGVAGGDGKNKGVRVMTVQMIDNSHGSMIGSAFTYAADNGAVIANCSWSNDPYDQYSESDHDGILYFNKYAGMDASGKVQIGPMAGGLVVFAAGNETNADVSYPAAFDESFSVASVGPDGVKTYYSTFGDWVDISATGGDMRTNYSYGGVYSCTAESDSSYGYMQGTSMAAPHVSGVAALVVSSFGGPGFTRASLISRLQDTADKSIYDLNEGAEGKMGAGLVNAGAAVSRSGVEGPEKITDLSGQAKSNSIELKWTVPSDPDDGKPSGYSLYYSDQNITNKSNAKKVDISNGVRSPGDEVTYSLSDLEFEKDYYFAVEAYDIAHNISELSDVLKVTTKGNIPPVITLEGAAVRSIKPFERETFNFSIEDPDGHPVTISTDKEIPGVVLHVSSESKASLVVNGTSLYAASGAGEYEISLVASDSFDTAKSGVKIILLANNAPVNKKAINDIVFDGKGKSETIDLSEYFHDPDGEALSYDITTSNTSIIVDYSVSGNALTLTSHWFGQTVLSVKAKDTLGESVTLSFNVLVRDGSQPVDLYPNPMSDYLFVRTGDNQSGSIKIFSQSGAAVIDQSFETGPFNPLKLDVSGFSAGTYVVSVKLDGQEYKKTVVKL